MLEPFREGSSVVCFCVYLLTVETSAEVFRGSLKKKGFFDSTFGHYVVGIQQNYQIHGSQIKMFKL